MNSATVRFFIPFVISAGLLLLVAYSVRGEVNQLPDKLSHSQWWLLVPAVGLYFVGVWLRSARWGLLLPEHKVKTSTLFRALVVGFTINNVLPLRMGEVARAYLLARWASIPYGSTIASLVVERVLDGFSLALLLLLAIALLPSAPGYLLIGGAIATGGFLAGLVVLALAAWRASLLTSLASLIARRLPARFEIALNKLAENFARSLALVHDPLRLVRLLVLSLLAWSFELGLFFVILISFGLPASYPLALLVGSSANFATLIPSSPGYAGTFDGVLVKVLSDVAGVPASTALSYDVVVHGALFLPVVVVGTLVLWRSHVKIDQITHAPSTLSTQHSALSTEA